MFVFDDYFEDDIEGVKQETYLFSCHVSGDKFLTFGVQFLDNKLSSVYVCDENGEWVDEGTDVEDIMNNPKGWFDSVISKVSESKKHTCSMQKKESLLAKKNESVSLPQDVKDAMKKVQAFLQDNYTAITNSGLVSDEDCSVGYQLDCTLNVLGDVVANFPKG